MLGKKVETILKSPGSQLILQHQYISDDRSFH